MSARGSQGERNAVGVNTDSAPNELADRKRAQALLSAQRRTLEMIAGSASLADVLEDLCDTIYAQAPEIISSILLMDTSGEQLVPVSGRRVPEGWTPTITPLPIGPRVGSCGTAAFLKVPVIVSDIASDPLWTVYRDVALSHGLRAAWSYPLISKDDEVLGTFGMYYSEPRTPSESDLDLIEGAANIAVIAIEGERSRNALKKAFEEIKQSESRLRKIIDTIPTLAWCNLPDGSNEFLNKRWHEYTGISTQEAPGWGWQAAFHPEDLPPLMEKWREMLVSGEPGEIEARLRRHDGVYRWFLIRAEPFRDESGKIVRWYGTSTDIDDRKRAEEALQSNERNLSLIINTMPTLAWSALPDGSVDFVNQRWLDYQNLPAEIVMSTEDMVDAALIGLDKGELVTLPSLHDGEEWTRFEAARRAMSTRFGNSVPAPRYGVGLVRSV